MKKAEGVGLVVIFLGLAAALAYLPAELSGCGDCNMPPVTWALEDTPPSPTPTPTPTPASCLCDYSREARDPLYHCQKLDVEMDRSTPGCVIPPERWPNRSHLDLGTLPFPPHGH